MYAYIYGCHDCVVFGKKTDIAKSAKGSKVGLGFRNKDLIKRDPLMVSFLIYNKYIEAKMDQYFLIFI